MRRYDIRFGKLFTDTIGRKFKMLSLIVLVVLVLFCGVDCLPHTEPVTSVSFSRDGHCILVSSLDNRLRLLDKDNGEMLNR